jgi:hypothetical protein
VDVLQTLGRGQHRHGRRDHRIAIEQRGREHAKQDERRRPLGVFRLAVDQCEQGQAAALALVVGLHDGEDVLERHHDHHRPEHQAEHAVDVDRIDLDPRHPGDVSRKA